ncbi:hypothetical protein EW146_g10012, partial [Bondarzewia mesenterica]
LADVRRLKTIYTVPSRFALSLPPRHLLLVCAASGTTRTLRSIPNDRYSYALRTRIRSISNPQFHHARTRSTMISTPKPLTDAIKEDHREMYEYYDAHVPVTTNGDVDAQARWANQLTWKVARHAVGEEWVVYPLMQSHLGARCLELADRDRVDHQVWTSPLHGVCDQLPMVFFKISSSNDSSTTS